MKQPTSSSILTLTFIGSFSLVLSAYPASYSVGYGFIGHGGVGPHGHYLPAVARVKVHKDPLQTHYSLDEEGPTHYKYIRHSSTNPAIHVPPPPPLLGDHYHHHPIAAPVHGGVPLHGGVVHGGVPPPPVPLHGHGGVPVHGGVPLHGGVAVHGVHGGLPVHGGVIAAPPPVPPTAAVDYGSAAYYNDYGALAHMHMGYY